MSTRSCGRCGLAGHNRRTCPAELAARRQAESTLAEPVVVEQLATEVEQPEELDRDDSPSESKLRDLTPEEREAVDWYLELTHPGYLARRALRSGKEQ